MSIELDHIDLKILQILKENSRLSNKEIGAIVHRTGQAIGSRITRLIELNVIDKYTIDINYPSKQFIRLYMNDQQSFKEIDNISKKYNQELECYKVMGDSCYMIVSTFDSNELNEFIELISQWCRYSLEIVIRKII